MATERADGSPPRRCAGKHLGGISPARSQRARTWAGERGQAAVELVALLPLLAAVALGVLQALAAGVAAELAGHAAQTGAVALAEGRDGAAAARAAVPDWSRERIAIEVRGSRVRVRLTPPALVPGLGERLATTATADAGPLR